MGDISRPNTAAWLVCAGQELFVNTGAYGYDTPAGCADQTVSLFLSFVTCVFSLFIFALLISSIAIRFTPTVALLRISKLEGINNNI